MNIVNTCVFCRIELLDFDQTNITLATTDIGEENLAEFIKTSILHLSKYEELHSNYICESCLDTINALEEHFIKSHNIQKALVDQYFSANNPNDTIIDVNDAEFLEYVQNERSYSNEEAETTLEFNEKHLKGLLLEDEENIPKIETKIAQEIKVKVQNEKENCPTRKSVRLSKKKKRVYSLNPSYSSDEDDESEHIAAINNAVKIKGGNSKLVTENLTVQSTSKTAVNLKPRDRIYTCDICQRQYNVYNSYWSHIQQHKNKFECKICHSKFSERRYMERHYLRHPGCSEYKFPECQREFIKHDHLKRHMSVHLGNKQYVCEECGRSFRERYALRKHLIVHEKTILDQH